MKALAKLGYLAAACALLLTTFAVIGPRTVQAVVATLVRDTDNAARHPWTGSCGPLTTGKLISCTVPVPSGQEVVIQQVNLQGSAEPTAKTVLGGVLATTGGNTEVWSSSPAPDLGFFQPTAAYFNVTGMATMYADPGLDISCQFLSKTTITTATCFLAGYYVTLP
jgi:hypothetical protein